MVTLLLASTNKYKRNELQARLKNIKGIKIMSLEDLKIDLPMIVEDGKTFRANAVKKAIVMSRYFDGLVLADDSGLEVNALFGKPGVRSARFARKNATDAENIRKLLKLLEKVPERKRTAHFVCCLALAQNGKLLDTFQGKVSGNILEKKKGKNGFGYDPLFIPSKYAKTYAEMTPAYKNKISHRAEALIKFQESIGTYIV